MARSALFVVAFTAALAASFASIIPATRTSASDVIGNFSLRADISPTGIDCPRRVSHTDTVNGDNVVPHSVMIMGKDRVCQSTQAMQVIPDGDALSTAEGTNSPSSIALTNDFLDTNQDFIFGYEENGRECSPGRPIDNLPPQTLVFIFVPKSNVAVGSIALREGERTMVIKKPGLSAGCWYRAQAVKVDPTPKPTPSRRPRPRRSPSSTPEAPEPPASPTPAAETTEPTEPGAEPTDPAAEPTDPDAEPTDDQPGGFVPPGGTGDGDDDGTGGASETDDPDATVEEAEPTPTPDDDDVCFPADATVELESGEMKRMEEVAIGDRVRVSATAFSDVFMFTHKDAKTVHEFVEMTTSSGVSVSATAGHYVYINDRLAMAKTAKVGDMLELSSGDREAIAQVETVTKAGLYNPQTMHGDIVVNSVRASTFTKSVEVPTAQVMLSPLRALYSTLGLSTSAFDNGAKMIASFLPKGKAEL